MKIISEEHAKVVVALQKKDKDLFEQIQKVCKEKQFYVYYKKPLEIKSPKTDHKFVTINKFLCCIEDKKKEETRTIIEDKPKRKSNEVYIQGTRLSWNENTKKMKLNVNLVSEKPKEIFYYLDGEETVCDTFYHAAEALEGYKHEFTVSKPVSGPPRLFRAFDTNMIVKVEEA